MKFIERMFSWQNIVLVVLIAIATAVFGRILAMRWVILFDVLVLVTSYIFSKFIYKSMYEEGPKMTLTAIIMVIFIGILVLQGKGW